jgi:hypothetical protein
MNTNDFNYGQTVSDSDKPAVRLAINVKKDISLVFSLC